MPQLTAEDILAADDLERTKEYVPEWAPKGAEKPAEFYVWIKTLTGLERDKYEAELVKLKGPKAVGLDLDNVRARLLQRVLIGDDGKPLFSKDQVIRLGMKSAAVIDRLWAIARKLNGLSEDDVAELVGNSEAETAADSHSG